MYIDFPHKRKNEQACWNRIGLFFWCLRLNRKKRIPFMRKKKVVSQEAVDAYPVMEPKKRQLKKKLIRLLFLLLQA